MRAMVHSHIVPCEPCDQIGTNIQLDTKLDQTKEIINFKRRRCIENPRVGCLISSLSTTQYL